MLAYTASANPDTMYLHEAMQQPDKDEFLKAMEEEIRNHMENKNWHLVKCSNLSYEEQNWHLVKCSNLSYEEQKLASGQML